MPVRGNALQGTEPPIAGTRWAGLDAQRSVLHLKGNSMKTYTVSIVGNTSLLQHRFGETAEGESSKGTRRNVAAKQLSPREQAQQVEYRNDDGTYWLPGASISRLLREAGGGHKLKGSRKSAKYVIAGAVFVRDDRVTVLGDGDKPAASYEVDSRPVVIPATKGRVMRHRPRFDAWGARFTLAVNDDIIDPAFVHQLLNEGGVSVGIGDFRPEKGGPFGTFRVTAWEEVK